MRISARIKINRTGCVRWAPLAIVVALSACTEPASKVPAGPTGPDTVSVTIDGPSTIAPGQSAQLKAVLRLSDGSTKIAVAPNVTWRSSNTVLTVSTAGVATAKPFNGEAVITADVTRLTTNSVRTASREVVVLPDGTFRLVGTVTDAEFPTIPVTGARVQLASGSPTTTTDFAGGYKLYGVPPNADIRITADGYVAQTQSVQLTTNSTRNFQLALPGPRGNFTGLYRLAIDVTGSCGSPVLSADLQHRRYDATLTQTGPNVDVTLTEPIFRMNGTARGNHFTGQAGVAGVNFTIDPFYSYYYPYYGPSSYPNVAERLANGTILVIEGRANTTGSAAGLSGVLNGDLANYDSRFPNFAFILGSCISSSTIQFTLTPR